MSAARASPRLLLVACLLTAGTLAVLAACTRVPPASPATDAGPVQADGGTPVTFCVGRSDGTACLRAEGTGLCHAGACAACGADAGASSSPADDAACSKAFGVQALCVDGSCIQGNCRSDHDCPAGEICGLVALDRCGGCSTDQQCQGDPTYGPGTVCRVSDGACVSSACSVPHSACNGADAGYFCCANAAPSSGSTCAPGNCCGDGDCTGGQHCAGQTCSACPSVTNGEYFVDPVNGSDTATTGTSSCAFKTLTHALGFLGVGLASDVNVRIVQGPLSGASLPDGGAGSGERFPIEVPAHVHVLGNSSAVPTLFVPSGVNGLRLNGPNSSVSYLRLEGSGAALNGITVGPGSDTSTSLDHVTVSGMASDGILVRGGTFPDGGAAPGGVLSVGPGTSASLNGLGTTAHSGLVVEDAAQVVVTTNAEPVSFNGNGADGIQVLGSAVLSLHGAGLAGTASGNGQGNVTANNNGGAGVFISHAADPATASSLDGLVASGNACGGSHGAALALTAGSRVRVRNCVLVGNKGPGVRVSNGRGTSVSLIDLGSDVKRDPGRNILQVTAGLGPNSGAGVCFAANSVTDTLLARGNIFSAGDCTTRGVTLTAASSCTTSGDYFEERTLLGTGNTIDASACTGP